MIRVLILGAGGMLGHKVFQRLADWVDAIGTARTIDDALAELARMTDSRMIEGVDARDFESVVRTLSDVKPDVVVNCVGIIKQRPEGDDAVQSNQINAV